MKTEQFRHLIDLFESRDPDTTYTETNDKIVIELTSTNSAAATRLAKKYLELKEAAAAAKAEFDKVNDELHDFASSFKDPADDLKTCYYTLQSTIEMSLAKKTTTESIKWEEIVKKLAEDFTPELTQKFIELQKTMVKTTNKSPALRVKPPVDESVGDIFNRIKTYFSNWATDYTNKLNSLSAILG
jgi:hypothetical protein